MGSARAIVMKFLVLLSIVSLACAAPMPEGEEAPVAVEAEAPAAVEEEAPAALPYVHDATGDVAEAYVHDATGDVAEPYVHEDMPPEIPAVEEEIAAEPYVHHHRFCGALGLSVTSLTHHHSLRDGLTDWQGMHNGSRVGISQAIERISLSISCRGSNGSGGQEGKLEDGLDHDDSDSQWCTEQSS